MLNILYFFLFCLSLTKLVISRSVSESSTKLPVTSAEESLLNEIHEKKNKTHDESELPIKDEDSARGPENNEPESTVLPVENLLEMVQIEIKESEDTNKTQYFDLLTHLKEQLGEDAQKVKVLFKNVWRVVDLGVRGSPRRQRSVMTIQGLLQSLKDLWRWFCHRIFSMTTWYKPYHNEKEINELDKLDHEAKRKLLEAHSEERENYYSTTPPKEEKKG
ncbi:uncharacterized protein LOC135844851 [Planococcus citri]|uniref:uncharacterized protein LOC135844851 n=1 Tax=Planococcus citri TaxID=170843 RepID=UPI0031FA30DC